MDERAKTQAVRRGLMFQVEHAATKDDLAHAILSLVLQGHVFTAEEKELVRRVRARVEARITALAMPSGVYFELHGAAGVA